MVRRRGSDRWLAILVVTAALLVGFSAPVAPPAPAAPPGPRCAGQLARIVGTPGPPGHVVVINGTPGPDVIVGTDGPDIIDGLGGDDIICGGRGEDRLIGGDGNDRLFGELEDDALFGGPHNDFLSGGAGDDGPLVGGEGDDAISGGDDRDVESEDEEFGSFEAALDGGPGNDYLMGGTWGDSLAGGDNNDYLLGGGGKFTLEPPYPVDPEELFDMDDLLGGDGDDVLYVQDGESGITRADIADGQQGNNACAGESIDVLTNCEPKRRSDDFYLTLVPYESSDWEFKTEGATGFRLGQGAFGSNGNCPFQATVNTFWPAGSASDPGILQLRRTIQLPAAIGMVRVRILIDNDFVAFWNGSEIGRATREGCPIVDPEGLVQGVSNRELVLTVRDEFLNLGGSNTLTVRARDRGIESFIDVSVTARLPAVP